MPPADKSISHRAALLGAMAAEPVRIENYLRAADTESTLAAVEALGALVERDGSELVLRGTGIRDAREPGEPIDVGNAGTLLRLLPGWLAAQSGRTFTLDGDESIRRRPVARIVAPLSAMGAELEARGDGYTPLRVRGSQLRAVDWKMDVASAQVKSCVLLAGLAADGTTRVTEPTVSRDHTERMLRAAGVAVSRAGTTVTVVSADDLALGDLRVPGDVSSAAFLIAAGVLVPRSRLLIRDVGVNWTRTGFLRIVRRMRGIVFGELEEPQEQIAASEPVSDLDVAHGALEGTTVGLGGGSSRDRRAAARGPARLLRRGPDGRERRTGAARQGVRPHQRRRRWPARPRRRDRGDRRRIRRAGHRRPAWRHARLARRPPHGDARCRRGPRFARGCPGPRDGGGGRFLPVVRAGPGRPVLIAIDGPAGAGKSTVARAVADRLGFDYLDSGAMYRCVGLMALRDPSADAAQLARDAQIELSAAGVVLDGEDVTGAIRSPAVSAAASHVAADSGVRDALVDKQRQLLRAGDWVCEGRDIGTVVAPQAELKIFLTADASERARRRAAELGETVDATEDELAARDARDSARAHSPLRAADDAVVIDATDRTAEEVVSLVVALARERA